MFALTDEVLCPACGDPTDYCPGHGDIADPEGARVLSGHDAGNHVDCDPDGCEWASECPGGVEGCDGYGAEHGPIAIAVWASGTRLYATACRAGCTLDMSGLAGSVTTAKERFPDDHPRGMQPCGHS